MNISKQTPKILIVGAGPTGMTMACHLLKRGIPCRIIDRAAHQTTESKAININSASMAMFDRMGIADRFMEKGRKIKHIYCHWHNKRVVHVDYSRIQSPYHFFLSMPQAKSEAIIAQYLSELGGNIERRTDFLSAEVVNHGVKVTIKNAAGQEETQHYDYLLACDGAKSSVRNHFNIPFKGVDYHMHYHLFDGYIETSVPIVDTHYFVTEEGYFIIAPMVDGYYRMVLFDVNKGSKLCSHEELQALVNDYGPGYIQLKDIIWQSKGFFYNRLLDDFRYKDRVLFAGDAAHIFSPLGGHGMNTSLHDTDNLAWKLAGIIQYGWNDRILDTYTEERKEIASVLITNTDFSTRLINKTERDFIPNLENWLPLLHKRGIMRNRTAYQFSGLAQQFQHSDIVVSHDCHRTAEDSIVGKYLPYVGNLICNNQIIDTYRLSKQVPVLLLFGSYSDKLLELMKEFGFYCVRISNEANQSTIDSELSITNVIDSTGEIMKKCAIDSEDMLLLRPDGVIGFKAKSSSISKLSNYLENWFVRSMVCA